MNLDHLRYFCVLAKTEHYTKASEICNISQPTLTYAVSQLEAELGVPLFEKKGRRIHLTRYGEDFLRTVKSSLSVLDSGVRSLMEEGESRRCILIGSIRTLGTTLLPSLMHDFQLFYGSDIKYQLHSIKGTSSSILQELEDGKLDFSFTSIPGDPEVFETIPFIYSRFVVVVPPFHPLAGKDGIRLEETLPYPQIFFTETAGLRKSVDSLFREINASPSISMETEEDAVIAGLVSAGFGIAVLPDDPLLKSLPLNIIPLTSPSPERTAYLSRLQGTELTPAAESFWQYAGKRLAR